VTALPKPVRRRCKNAAKQDPESHRPTATPLAGDASVRPSFCGDGRWMIALDCTGRVNPERRTRPPAACCRITTGVKVPLLTELLEHPWVSSILRAAGWMLPPSSVNRPRPSFLRQPAKGNAFPKAGMPSTLRNPGRDEDRSSFPWIGTLHYAAARLSSGGHCNRGYQRLWFHLRAPDSGRVKHAAMSQSSVGGSGLA